MKILFVKTTLVAVSKIRIFIAFCIEFYLISKVSYRDVFILYED